MTKIQKQVRNEREIYGYSAVIPTIGREETLPMVLMALAHQVKLPSEVIILDESKKPVSENYCVNQALDVLSLKGCSIKTLRSRRRKGIGAARLQLAAEASNEFVLMIDDDVVLEPNCAKELLTNFNKEVVSWAVPTCLLVPASFSLDGYTDKVVRIEDPAVQVWTQKYPWFIPYFQYEEPFECLIPCSGTQCILLKKEDFLEACSEMGSLGNLPREDTYMTSKMGNGLFISRALCHHFEHPSQAERDNWSSSMFYRLHEACMESPDEFVSLLGVAR
jgi:glycosyltransferase involved in cell wall biosynthesis